MLTAVKATYDNGQIIWDERPPVHKKTRVVITFLEEDAFIDPALKKRQGGSMKGQISLSEDFNEPLDDLNEYM
ncbi:DUF2281 domain-containing protein [Spirosoma utsteinense]|uniref:DUF2281 domain-containing protein n=1 Tax=Spirosoma utsteinense TaxID=2585773 RepID=A0ABR6WAP4_9BACT|nr:DUF2281 domain-containing protein [Spirosoma utsteinense]MBC3787832.1 hypothetical protein [Spirosoma utsteinense]MBC3793620.1 hypothetical protein [Spirosoma utsteinense]